MTASIDPEKPQPADLVGKRLLAEASLHRAIGRAHTDFATMLTALTPKADVEKTPVLGSAQRRIVALPAIATSRGITSREAAAATTGDEPNCHTALKALVGKDIVEVVDGSSPQRFRLAVQHRRDKILRLSRLIEEGEWTTYGDFAIAVYDSSRMALTVARVASRHPAFANPHRLLQATGTVSPEWHDEEGHPDPEECKRRLREEQVWDDEKDKAKDTATFVGWEELRRRLMADEEADDDLLSAA